MGFDRKETHSFVAGEALTRFALVKLDTTANQVVYADEGQTEGLFVTQAAVASGRSVACLPLPAASGTFKLQAAGAVALGAKVGCANTSGQVDDSHAAQGVAIALEAATGAGQEFLCSATAPGSGGTVQAQTAAGTALTNTTTETTISSVEVIEGESLSVGDVIEVFAIVDVTSTNSTDTLKLDLMLGTEEICNTGAVDVADNDIGIIHAFITIRAVGATGSLVGGGYTCLDAAGTLKTTFIKDVAAEDLSGSLNVYLDGTWSVASASNSCACETFIVKHHRA